MACVLRCEKVKKTYQEGKRLIPVLSQVDLQVAPGESVAVVGRSGSGKTTLLNILGGLELPDGGEIFLNQVSLRQITSQKRDRLRNGVLGFIFQFHHLLPEFTALENVSMPLLIRGVAIRHVREKAMAILERVGLAHRYSHKPAALSGGERQRVAIARALITEPQCVLADEPTGNLDEENAKQVYQLMMELIRDLQTAFVVVTHDSQLAKRMDRVMILTQGVLEGG